MPQAWRGCHCAYGVRFFSGAFLHRAAPVAPQPALPCVVTVSLPLGNRPGPTSQKAGTALLIEPSNPRSRCVVLWAACAEPVLRLSTIYGVRLFCDAGRVF